MSIDSFGYDDEHGSKYIFEGVVHKKD